MTTTPPPMPDVDPMEDRWHSTHVYTEKQMQAWGTQWMERITALEGEIAVLNAWKARIIRSSERAYGKNAIRYKFSLTRTGKCMNTFPKEIDGRWFALTPAEDDGHIGHIARIDALEADRKMLREALRDLLDDTQHTDHPNCEDGPCPVRAARTALRTTHD